MIEEEFQKCFAVLENEFGKQSDEIKDIWYRLFNIYRVNELEEAIKHYLKVIKKFPLPAIIIEDVEWIRKYNSEKAYWKAMIISNKNEL